jgi:hypothetical protein
MTKSFITEASKRQETLVQKLNSGHIGTFLRSKNMRCASGTHHRVDHIGDYSPGDTPHRIAGFWASNFSNLS